MPVDRDVDREGLTLIEYPHKCFLRWAAVVLAPVPGVNLGYGKNILLKIVEGKGQIMPGAPRGSGVSKIHTDPMFHKVDKFLLGRSKEEGRLIRTFYLDQSITVARKAEKLGLPTRTMYSHIERAQHALNEYLEGSE